MITPIRFLSKTDNKADSVTPVLTTATVDADFPLANLQHPFKTKTFRTDSTESDPLDLELTWDLGAANTVNCVFIVNHNLDSGGTFKLQGHTADSWGSPDVDETLTHNSGIIVKFFTGGSKRYWRLDLDNTSSAESFTEMGRVFFGSFYEVERSFKVGWRDRAVDFSTRSQTVGGQIHSDKQDTYRLLELDFSRITTAEKLNNLLPFVEDVQTTDFFMASLDIDNQLNAYTFYVKIERMPILRDVIHTYADFSITLREVL